MDKPRSISTCEAVCLYVRQSLGNAGCFEVLLFDVLYSSHHFITPCLLVGERGGKRGAPVSLSRQPVVGKQCKKDQV